MKKPVTILIKRKNGETREFTTKDFGTPENALKEFLNIHKDSIRRLEWLVTLKSQG